MATHSSVLAWRIPGTGEPGGLPSMGSHRVRHDWSDLAAAAPTSDEYLPMPFGYLCALFRECWNGIWLVYCWTSEQSMVVFVPEPECQVQESRYGSGSHYYHLHMLGTHSQIFPSYACNFRLWWFKVTVLKEVMFPSMPTTFLLLSWGLKLLTGHLELH